MGSNIRHVDELARLIAAFEAGGYTVVSRTSAQTTNSVYIRLAGQAADEFASLFRGYCEIRVSDHHMPEHMYSVSPVAYEYIFDFLPADPVAEFEAYVQRCREATAADQERASRPSGPSVTPVTASWKLEAISAADSETLARRLKSRRGVIRHPDGRVLTWSGGVAVAVRAELARRAAD